MREHSSHERCTTPECHQSTDTSECHQIAINHHMGACTHLHMSKLINPLSKHSSYERCASPYCINLHTCAEIAMLRPCLICGYLMYLIFSIASWPLPPLVCVDCWCFPCCVLFCSSLAITLPAAAYLRKFGAKYWRHLFCFNVIYKYLYKLLCLNNICITWRFFSVLRLLSHLRGILIGANLLVRKIHIR